MSQNKKEFMLSPQIRCLILHIHMSESRASPGDIHWSEGLILATSPWAQPLAPQAQPLNEPESRIALVPSPESKRPFGQNLGPHVQLAQPKPHGPGSHHTWQNKREKQNLGHLPKDQIL